MRLVAQDEAPFLEATEPGGRRFLGAAAACRVLRELGGPWALAGRLYLVPPVGWLADRYYSRISRRRAWW